MSGEKEDFHILLWSKEDIKIDNEDLVLMVKREAPGVEIYINDFEGLREMEVSDLKSFLDDHLENSVLIISSSEKAENMHSWKLGFIMGKLSVKKGKARIIVFVKGDQTSCFQELGGLLSICESEIKIKRDIKSVIKDIGIKIKYDSAEYAPGKKAAGKEEI